MSGGATESQVEKAWASIKKYLRDRRTGGFRLNTNFNSLYLSLGRGFGFSYGDKENGAFFNHMVVMLANALYKRGFANEGFEALNSIYEMATSPQAKIFPMIPEYFNDRGRGLYCYLTGSASWYIYTLIEEVLGVKFSWGDISLKPGLIGRNFFKQTIEVKFEHQGKLIKAVFIREGRADKCYRIRKVFLDNKQISGCIIDKKSLSGLSRKEVTLKVYLG
jgi:cellobiose phosphorylase